MQERSHSSSFEDEPVRGYCAKLTFDRPDPDLANAPRDQLAYACSEIELELRYSEGLQPRERWSVLELAVWDWIDQVLPERVATDANST